MTTLLAALVACALALSANAAAADGKEQSMSEARSAFAKALGATAKGISEFRVVAVTGVAPVTDVWLGTNTVDGEPQAWAVAACQGRPCAGAPVSLPTASALAVVAVLDLQGAPFKLDLRELPKEPAQAQPFPAKPAKPAVLVRARHKLDSGELRDTLVVVAVDKTLSLPWQETANSTLPNGGGFQSLELSFVKGADAPWLAIRVLQHALPAKGQQPAMPGPPLVRQFSYRDGAYKRDR